MLFCRLRRAISLFSIALLLLPTSRCAFPSVRRARGPLSVLHFNFEIPCVCEYRTAQDV